MTNDAGNARWLQINDASEWDAALEALPMPHVLQRWAWGQFKSRWGWSAQRWLMAEGGEATVAVQVLKRRVGPLCVLYAPKGPAVRDRAAYFDALEFLKQRARAQGAIWLKVDGDLLGAPFDNQLTAKPLSETLAATGWRFSASQVQFRNTGFTRVAASDDAQLASMHQKWRYNIRLAARRGVTVRVGGERDFGLLYSLYAETGERDGFAIRQPGYYYDAWRSMNAHALIAEREGVPLAAVVLFGFGGRGWYFYGMSRTEGREHMATYAVQFECLRWARARGYATYDWWGAPDRLDDPTDAMQSVWRWKEGFGAKFIAGVGAWDYAPFPLFARIAQRFKTIT